MEVLAGSRGASQTHVLAADRPSSPPRLQKREKLPSTGQALPDSPSTPTSFSAREEGVLASASCCSCYLSASYPWLSPLKHQTLSFQVIAAPSAPVMSITRIAVLLALSVVLPISLSHAATVVPSTTVPSPVYTIGELGVGGSGCPPEDVTTGKSPDGTGVSVIFRSFNVSTDADNTRVRAACGIALPIHAQPGQSVGFFKVDFRGYVHVPNEPDAAAVLTTEYFFAGQQGIKVKHTYLPGDDKDIFDTNTINFQSVIWSPCGGSTVFRVNTAVAATRHEASEVGASRGEVMIVLDSVDSTVKGSIHVAVASRACDPLTGDPI